MLKAADHLKKHLHLNNTAWKINICDNLGWFIYDLLNFVHNLPNWFLKLPALWWNWDIVELPASWLISPSAWFLLLVSVWLQLVGLRCHSGLGEHHHPPPIVLDNPRKVLDTCKFIAFCNSWEYEKLFQFTKKPNWCAIGLALMVVLIRLIFRVSLYKESRLKQYIE